MEIDLLATIRQSGDERWSRGRENGSHQRPEGVAVGNTGTTKAPENKRRRVTYIVNHNGRRYANIKTGDDILVELPVKESKPREHDCMPDVMAAIAAAKERDIAAIRLANKSSSYYSQVGSVDRIYIGVNSD